MANQELIYLITRAIYDRLGTSANEQTVEELVTDIYRAVEPALDRNVNGRATAATAGAGAFGATTATEGSSSRLIISVFGVDHPGIVAGVAEILSELSAVSLISTRLSCRESSRW